ncbi:PIN domain-like protein [Mycena rosella]|uniref:PIN domain-like protein n=1 Tax=Mycena rosella TaxID=1033263 RepID=A0AAD7CVK2_MYCRO|nr:PIN domain-like protein [Mycena rosella]
MTQVDFKVEFDANVSIKVKGLPDSSPTCNYDMGVPGLWKCLIDAAEVQDFLQLTVQQGFKNGGPCEPILMGVDASIWMYQVDRAITYTNARAGPNPQLRALFYRLAALLELPIRVVFVFDGPARPIIKRNTRVNTNGHWLTAQFQALIRDFGYHSHTAPAEADAELGRLASEQIIDIVETTDSDVFVFGAPAVVYTPRKKTDGNNVTIYTAENLFITPSVGLTRGGTLVIALFSGGDHHKGIPGCGIATAHAIARGTLGDRLLYEAQRSPVLTPRFLEFLIVWAIAATIEATPAFPYVDVIFAYVHPITSWTSNYTVPDYASWGLACPNLTSIARSCQLQFGWGAATIAAKFSKLLYSGIAIQSLLKPYNLHALLEAHIEFGLSTDDDFPRSSVLRVLKRKTAALGVESYHVEMSAGALTLCVKAGLNDASAFPAPTVMIKWIPAAIIDYALPDLISRSKTVKAKAPKSRSKVQGRPLPAREPVAGPSRVPGHCQDFIDLTTPEPEEDIEAEGETIPDDAELEEDTETPGGFDITKLQENLLEASKGVTNETDKEYKRLMQRCLKFLRGNKLIKESDKFFTNTPNKLVPLCICAWIMHE